MHHNLDSCALWHSMHLVPLHSRGLKQHSGHFLTLGDLIASLPLHSRIPQGFSQLLVEEFVSLVVE